MTHQWNNDETIAKTTVIYDNAHNEYLQYFVTIGPIGVLSYVGILICACIEMNRRKEKSPYVSLQCYAMLYRQLLTYACRLLRRSCGC